ncbi:MAG: sporulation protein YqfD [Oscillospiraceae bacterium]|jgi:similar to stage IV sporulation protein
MFLIALIRYIRGYVRFSVRGMYVERFLNFLARERIVIWGAKRREDCLSACVAAARYPQLRPLARKAGVKLRLMEKRGLPFQRKKLSRRRGLVVGLGFFILFLFIMSRFIWSIQVNVQEKVPPERILSVLEELGVKPGILRSSIQVREIESKALLRLPELSWIALNIDGSTIYVEVNETMPVPPMVDPGTPCNVVASHSGQILELQVYSGQPVLQKGEAVLEGQIIVSGITQDKRGQNTFRHARADVLAEVSLSLEVAVPLDQITYEETGKTLRRNYLRVLGAEFPLFLPLPVPRPYLAERSRYPLMVGPLELPLARRLEQYTLMREVPVVFTEEQAKKQALLELSALEQARLGDSKIIERTLVGRLDGRLYRLRADYICHMNIALQKEILQGE